MAGTEKIIASLKIGLVSSLFMDVFFLLIFLPSWSRYTFTNGSVHMETDRIQFMIFTHYVFQSSRCSWILFLEQHCNQRDAVPALRLTDNQLIKILIQENLAQRHTCCGLSVSPEQVLGFGDNHGETFCSRQITERQQDLTDGIHSLKRNIKPT